MIPFRRIAIVGAWAPHRTEDACARAARRLGLESRVFNVLGWRQRLKSAAAPLLERAILNYHPDFILFTRHAVPLGPLRTARLMRGRAAALWHFDAEPQEGVVELGRQAGTMYTAAASQVPRYLADGVPVVRFLPQALDSDMDRPATGMPATEDICDVSFIGSGQYPHRWPLLQAVSAHARLQIRGPGWDGAPADLPIAGGTVHGERFAEVVAGASISLGANALPSQDTELLSTSNRMWKIFGCGGAFVGRHVAGIDEFARHGEHCRWYHSTEECLAQVADLLAHPSERLAMAQRGHAHALAHHTYEARMKMLLCGEGWPLPSL